MRARTIGLILLLFAAGCASPAVEPSGTTAAYRERARAVAQRNSYAGKAGAGASGIALGTYDATPGPLADGQNAALLLGPNNELVMGSSSTSTLRVQGTTEDGVQPLTSEDAPVLVGGRDASGQVQQFLTDIAGRQPIVGAQSDGAAAVTSPVLIAGIDGGGLAQALSVDAAGRTDVNLIAGQTGAQGAAGVATASTQRVTVATDDVVTVDGSAGAAVQQGGGAASAATLRVTQATDDLVPATTSTDGGAVPARMQMVGGTDGANAQTILLDTAGRSRGVGAAADGAAAAGDPIQIAGVDGGGLTQRVLTDAGGAVQVDVESVPAPLSTTGGGTEAAALRVTVASDSTGVLALSELPAPAALADNVANPTTTSVGAHALVWDGATWDRAGGDSANGADVDVTRMPADATELPAAAALADATANPTITSTGSFPHVLNDAGTWDRVSGDTTALYAQGPTASDGVIVARPITIGGRASTANPAAMSADGDVVDFALSRIGAVKITGGTTATIDTTARTADVQLVAANAGNRLVWFSVRESAGAAAAATVVLRHGTLATSPAIAYVELTANESTREVITVGLPVPNGVFLDWIAGEVDVTVWTEDHE